jgi:hypothetical protein
VGDGSAFVSRDGRGTARDQFDTTQFKEIVGKIRGAMTDSPRARTTLEV